MAANEVDVAMVMPQPYQGLEVVAAHDRVARLIEREPGVIYGMANVSPYLDEDVYRREVTRCIRELDFRAIKLHPLSHTFAPNHPRAEVVFASARELRVPVLIHTGTGAPAALPSLAIPPALAYPDVTVVLAHAGFAVYTAEAIVAATVCPNIVLEPSWCTTFHVEAMVAKIGPDRVMFGSDHPSNVAVELAKFRSIELDQTQLGAVLGGTALRVFNIDPPREKSRSVE
jgi:predicted TIM-barrel fold metal-dependent hydrolase